MTQGMDLPDALSHQSVSYEHHRTHILRSAKYLSELSSRTQSASQAEVHDLDVSRRRQAGQEDVLGLGGKRGVNIGQKVRER